MPKSKPTPTPPVESDRTRITERPDGFYWQSLDGGREYGPFPTLLEAQLDMQAVDDEAAGDADTAIRDAEAALGVPEWVDPETGHLADDEWTRTEEH